MVYKMVYHCTFSQFIITSLYDKGIGNCYCTAKSKHRVSRQCGACECDEKSWNINHEQSVTYPRGGNKVRLTHMKHTHTHQRSVHFVQGNKNISQFLAGVKLKRRQLREN